MRLPDAGRELDALAPSAGASPRALSAHGRRRGWVGYCHRASATLKRIALGGLGGIAIVFNATLGFAQTDAKPPPAPATVQGQTEQKTQTLKERLGDKASDEQRVDDCKVPLERRGSKPRPDRCE
jgi:hypothetical protein